MLNLLKRLGKEREVVLVKTLEAEAHTVDVLHQAEAYRRHLRSVLQLSEMLFEHPLPEGQETVSPSALGEVVVRRVHTDLCEDQRLVELVVLLEEHGGLTVMDELPRYRGRRAFFCGQFVRDQWPGWDKDVRRAVADLLAVTGSGILPIVQLRLLNLLGGVLGPIVGFSLEAFNLVERLMHPDKQRLLWHQVVKVLADHYRVKLFPLEVLEDDVADVPVALPERIELRCATVRGRQRVLRTNVLETQQGCLLQLLENVRLRPFFFDFVDEDESKPDDLFNIRESFFGQYEVHAERRDLIVHPETRAGVARRHKVILDQFAKQRVLALVTDAVRNVIQRTASPVLLDGWQLWPLYFESSEVFVRHNLGEMTQRSLVIDLRVKNGLGKSFVLNCREVLDCEFFKLVQGIIATKTQLHQIRRIVPIIVREKKVPDIWLVECLKVAGAKVTHCMVTATDLGTKDLINAPLVVAQILLEFVIHSIHLSLRRVLSKRRLLEEVTEHVQCRLVEVVLNRKVIIGEVLSSRCVFVAAVSLNKLAVCALFRVLLCPEEEHMLAEMRQTLGLRRVVEVA